MPPLLYTARFPVRWDDIKLGHVNNAVFFAYFEQARTDWLSSVLPPNWIEKAAAVVLSTRCDYKRPVLYPADLVVRVYGGAPGRTSFSQTYEVTVDDGEDTVYAEGEAALVWVARDTERPTPLPDALRETLPTARTA